MNAASWVDLLTQQRIGQALAAVFSAGLFLYGGLILLPKARPRHGARGLGRDPRGLGRSVRAHLDT